MRPDSRETPYQALFPQLYAGSGLVIFTGDDHE